MNPIRFLKRKQINDLLWDQSVGLAQNTLPYAYTWYLDAVAENWDALVLDNYRAIMPLVWLKKYGAPCLYQPYYCQQLGIFGNNISDKELAMFLDEAAKRYVYIFVNLNPIVASLGTMFKLSPKTNYLLSLQKNYDETKKTYSDNHKRNISKALKQKCEPTRDISLEAFQQFYIENIKQTQVKFEAKHQKCFLQLTNQLNGRGYALIYGVYFNNNLLAAAMLIKHDNRLINIINVSNEEGKIKGASHLLFDTIIRENTHKFHFLDFEGSSIPSIARFYKGFGASPETFYLYRTNILKAIADRIV